MSDSPVFTPVSEVGEFGLIARLQEVLGDAARSESLTTPIGDDAAVSDLGGGRSQVITTDLFVEGVHFDRTFAPLRALGWKCVAASVSDVCAMNATPTLVTVALGLPNNLSRRSTPVSRRRASATDAPWSAATSRPARGSSSPSPFSARPRPSAL